MRCASSRLIASPRPGAALRPPVRPGQLAVDLLEAREHQLQVLARNPDPGVDHPQRHPPAGPRPAVGPGLARGARDRDPPARLGELHRVRQQVDEDLPHAVLVAEVRRPVVVVAGRRAAVAVGQLDGAVRGRRPHQGDRRPRGRGRAGGAPGDGHPAGLDLREVEHVVHEPEQVPPAGGDPVEVTPLGVRHRPGQPEVEQLGVAEHRVERGAQLVAHRRQERALRPTGRLRLAPRRVGLGPRRLRRPRGLGEPRALLLQRPHQPLALRLGPHPLRHVADDHAVQPPRGGLDLRDGRLDGELGAVAPQPDHRSGTRRALGDAVDPGRRARGRHRPRRDSGGAERGDRRAVRRAEARRDEAVERRAERGGRRHPEQPLRGRVEQHHPIRLVDGDDGVERRRDDRRESVLARGERRLGGPAGGDVAGDLDDERVVPRGGGRYEQEPRVGEHRRGARRLVRELPLPAPSFAQRAHHVGPAPADRVGARGRVPRPAERVGGRQRVQPLGRRRPLDHLAGRPPEAVHTHVASKPCSASAAARAARAARVRSSTPPPGSPPADASSRSVGSGSGGRVGSMPAGQSRTLPRRPIWTESVSRGTTRSDDSA
jgi:hypothetical protein